ncbi:hypothetical protein CCMSSC00406_0007947 [Pleurotus cornucopiae]|uniref:Uncharacterized protein n=1 Tax=Pleurotus cornucopiae TaxID=5321 RepID=A0ACB7IPC6_PLECO|nr:hypothetical protein CCMSSC00406_0007947 [Pleurotus cornucopiae]
MNEKELLIVAGDDADLIVKAQEIINIILSRTFWERLTAVKLYLEPLALAANITQASTTRLDQVLMTLAGLYHTYTSEPCFTEQHSNDAIIDSLRKRWLKCDQDVFIVAVFLNPYIRGHFFNGSVHSLSQPGLFNVVKWVYARVFQETKRQVPIQLFENYLNYFDNISVYTDDGMNLTETKKMYDNVNQHVDIARIWYIWQFTTSTTEHQLDSVGQVQPVGHQLKSTELPTEHQFNQLSSLAFSSVQFSTGWLPLEHHFT